MTTTPDDQTRAELERTRADLARVTAERDDLRAQLARLGAAVPGAQGDGADVMARAQQVLALPARFVPGETYRVGSRYGKIEQTPSGRWAACMCEDGGLLDWWGPMRRMTEADADSAQREGGRPPVRVRAKHADASGTSWWTTEPAVGRVAHGVARRVDRLRAIGNGQVPGVAARAFVELARRFG